MNDYSDKVRETGLMALSAIMAAIIAWMVLAGTAAAQGIVEVEPDLGTQAWTAVGALVALGITMLGAVARWLGLQVSADLMAKLHSAVMSYVRAAVARGQTREEAWSGLGGYLEQSIPDTVKRLRQIATELNRVFGGGGGANVGAPSAAPVLSVLFDGKYELAKAEAAGAAFVSIEGEVKDGIVTRN